MSTLPTKLATPVTVVDSRGAERLNSLAELAVADYGNGNGGNPFEPTASTPYTFIESADYNTFTLNRTALTYGFKTFGLVRSFIRTPVDDAFRGGVDITIPEIDDPDALKELHELMERENDLDVVKDVMTWGRLFGGSALLVATDQDPSTPLKPDSIKIGERMKFIAADRWELIMAGFDQGEGAIEQFANLQFGYAYTGDFSYYGVPIDKSRLTPFFGQTAPSLIRQRLQGWALSELEQCMREIQSYIKFQNLLFELVDEAKVDVYQIANFNDNLASAEGTALIKLRVALGNWIKNYKNALVMDKEDLYEQKQIAFGGLADIFEEFRINLCAALRMPMNKLFGQSAGGFSSGEDSLENYNAMIDVEIRDKGKGLVRTVIALRCRQLWGYEPKFSFAFKPLRVLNGVEEEAVKTSKQKRALDLYDRDLVDGQEVSEILKKESLLTIETAVEKGEREPISPLEMQQQQTDQDSALAKKKDAKSKENGLARIISMLDRRDRRKAA